MAGVRVGPESRTLKGEGVQFNVPSVPSVTKGPELRRITTPLDKYPPSPTSSLTWLLTQSRQLSAQRPRKARRILDANPPTNLRGSHALHRDHDQDPVALFFSSTITDCLWLPGTTHPPTSTPIARLAANRLSSRTNLL